MASIISKVEQLSPLVLRVLGCNPGMMTLQGTNTYIVGKGTKRLLIDTGEANKPEYIKHLKQTLAQQQAQLEGIILTHWHHDHVGGIHSIEQDVLQTKVPLYKFQRPSDINGHETPPESKSKYTFVKYGQKLQTEGATLRLIYTPGHTDDHMVLLLEEENVVFSADCILGEGTAVFEDLYDYIQSLEKIVGLKPVKIYPGHGPVIENPVEKIQYYISHRQQRENQIKECLSNGECMTSMEIVKQVYHVAEHLHIPADKNVQNHLRKLQKENHVEQQDGKYRLKSQAQL